MEGWDINLFWRDTVRPAILVGKYRLYPRIPCLQAWGVCQRHFGKDVTVATTYKDVFNNQKGFVVGANYVPAENILTSVKYFDGKDIDSDTDANRFYFNVDFFF